MYYNVSIKINEEVYKFLTYGRAKGIIKYRD